MRFTHVIKGAIASLVVLGVVWSFVPRGNSSHSVQFQTYDAPYSIDPMDHDMAVNKACFSSVHATLVTRYRVGSPAGVLAESWTTSDDLKIWKFKIREGMTFGNGDPITPENVVQSFERIRKLMIARNSKSGVFDKMVAEHPISVQGQELVLKFSEPMPDLLNLLGFGLYSVVHRSMYDAGTGEWKNKRQTIASGPWRIAVWDENHIQLTLRKEFPRQLMHPSPVSEIEIHWGQRGSSEKPDLIYGISAEKNLEQQGFQYVGAAESGIAYLRCQSWNDPKSPCHDRSMRVALRDQLHLELQKSGAVLKRSFFPLSLGGVKELQPEKANPSDLPKGSLRFRPFAGILANLNKMVSGALQSADPAAQVVETRTPREQIVREYDPETVRFSDDLVGAGTSITVANLRHSIRFMFLSKEGIRLPDPTGEIREELKNPEFNIQKINELLWRDAIIWPIAHFGIGLWNRDNRLDFSMYNSVETPVGFEWLGQP